MVQESNITRDVVPILAKSGDRKQQSNQAEQPPLQCASHHADLPCGSKSLLACLIKLNLRTVSFLARPLEPHRPASDTSHHSSLLSGTRQHSMLSSSGRHMLLCLLHPMHRLVLRHNITTYGPSQMRSQRMASP